MRTIQVDLAAIRANYQLIKQHVKPAKVMAVVKANAYGHGMLQVAKTLDAIGVDALGVADITEAIELRRNGIKARILAWLVIPEDLALAAQHNIEVGISNFNQLEKLTENNQFHIKLDTGLGRNGFAIGDWNRLFAQLKGRENLLGIFSHLSNTSEVEDRKQKALFDQAVARLSFPVPIEKHLAASGAALSYSDFNYDMVRCGIAVYGLNPHEDKPAELTLQPAMRAAALLTNCKEVAAGQGVSYGYRYKTDRPTTLGLVPFGYGEGMPRISLGHKVLIGSQHYPVVGRVAMDQFVVDLGGDKYALGEEVVIFGDGQKGEPSAEGLAATAQSVNYEIVTRIGGRANRVYLNP
jgi:alanine racemase